MELPKMTHEQELNLERFANLMVELIERHAGAVDKEEMQKRIDALKGAGNNGFSASFVVLWGNVRVNGFNIKFLEVFRCFLT